MKIFYEKPVSYSGKKLFSKCQLLFKRAYLDGVRDPSGPAAARGTELHALLESYFRGGEYPHANKTLAPWFDSMNSLIGMGQLVAELQVAVRDDWSPTHFEDPTAMSRGAFDLRQLLPHRVRIHDWKSGKVYPEHKEQGEHYVAMECVERDLYSALFHYLDIPLRIDTYHYTRSQRDELRKKIGEEIMVIKTTDPADYKANPSMSNCGWCPKSWRRGGDCRAAP